MALLKGAHGGEDNFDFIDRLLDTLEAERGPQVESRAVTPRESGSPLNVQSAWDAVGALDLCEAAASKPRAAAVQAGAGGAKPPHESMNNLLNRFCEDGDESIVDELLDNFLGSAGDAGSLIEAIGQGMLLKQPSAAPAPKTDLSAPVRMSQLRLQELESPCLRTWDALLLSARDLLQSARTSHSPRTAREAAAVPACVQDDAAPASPAHAAAAAAPPPPTAPEPAAPSTCSSGAPAAVGAEAGGAANEQGGSLSMDLSCAVARRDLLCKLNDMEDHEAMRSFMRSFLVGVRRRLLRDLPGGTELSDAGESAPDVAGLEIESASTEDFDDRDDGHGSSWSCRSVNTVTMED